MSNYIYIYKFKFLNPDIAKLISHDMYKFQNNKNALLYVFTFRYGSVLTGIVTSNQYVSTLGTN